ncbi:hypothetical protein GCM10023169_30380 [Georgenia halophila]|uniref:DUF4352 domain-containing protein n=1 Tax=Georgenia halophila TaxID=620889 RepID=A0ABP8LFQ1_9MICO
MRPSRSLSSAAVAAGASLLLAACGGGAGHDGAAPGQGESTSVEAPGPDEPTSSEDRPTQPPSTRPTTEPSPSERPPQERPTTEGERPPSSEDESEPDDPPDDPPTADRDGGGPGLDPDGGGGPTTDPEDAGEPTTPPTPDPVHGPTSPVDFGETYQWDNGLAVTVEAPHPLDDEVTSSSTEDESDVPTPEARRTEPPDDASQEETPTATPEEGGTAGTAPPGDVLVFDITVVNRTPEGVRSLYIAPKIEGAACECAEHFDPGAGLTGTPSSTLPPGEQMSFSVAFATSAPADLELQVWPEYRYAPALFVPDVGSA